MLKALRFVRGAVAKKDYLPVLTHFSIKDGRITSYNGNIALSAPLNLALNTRPNAMQMYRAIAACHGQTVITQLPNNSLTIKSGTFKGTIDCTSDEFPDIDIRGEAVTLPFRLVSTFHRLSPYISEDASRQWSRGILLRGKSAIVTNNVVLIEYWLGMETPVELIIPKEAVDEIVRIGEEPLAIAVSPHSLTFWYSEDRWLYVRAIDESFPNTDRYFQGSPSYGPFPETLFPSLATIRPFLEKEGSVHLSPSLLSILPPDREGTQIEVPGLEVTAKFSWEHLASLEAVATGIDWSGKPCQFVGDKLRGVIIAMRQ